jgi:hypothetical protein
VSKVFALDQLTAAYVERHIAAHDLDDSAGPQCQRKQLRRPGAAMGSIPALVVAIGFPIWYGWKTRSDAGRGHFETIALDVRVAERQAWV